jgi:hypothetical protein
MKKNLYLTILIVTIILSSCTTETEKINNGMPVDNKVTENILYNGSSKYSQIFRIDAPILGYSTIKQNSLANEEFYAIDDVNQIMAKQNDIQKVVSNNNVTFLVNGLNINEMQTNVTDGQQRAKAISNTLYGNDVRFTLIRNNSNNINRMKKISATDTTVMMYVPNLVEIISPKIEKSENLFPYCYYKGFELKWNSDRKNENGLVVIVEWYGTSLKEMKVDRYIRNIDIIPEDDGSCVLNDKIFDNIPENAIAYITLLRGNITVLDDVEADSYRLVAESHVILPLILIRNI